MSKLKGSILSILFLGMLVFPNISSASTIAELTAMLNSLLAQVASLQQQIVQQTGDSTQEWCHTFNTNLKYGDNGEEVKELRIALKTEGFDIETSSGFFDEKISSAVVGFQQKYKSEVLTPVGLSYGTGYVGASTRKKLNQLYKCGSQTVPVTTPVNGSCGSASGQTFSSTPTANLCSAGTPTEVKYGVDGKERYSWICVAPKMSADCYANKTVTTTSPTISSIQSKANSIGTVDAGGTASIYGTGFNGPLTIKIGNQEPKYVYVTGTSDTYAEFVVPQYSQSITASVKVTNSAGLTSNSYTLNIVVPVAVINGSCGSASGQTFSSTPTANLCSAGTPTEVKYGVDGKERYSWICVAPKMSADCYAYKIVATSSNPSNNQMASILESTRGMLEQMLNSIR